MTDQTLDRAKRLATATIGDVLDIHSVNGVVSGLPRRAGNGRAAGYAQTMYAQVGPLGAFTFEDFAVGNAFDAVVPDAMLVIDLGGAEVSTFGGLATLTVTRRKAAGVVIDGGCRDVEEITAHGLTLASRHVTPRTGKGRLKVVSLGSTVSCGGVTVRPGDLVVVDDTGTVVIPQEMIETILSEAEELDKRDISFAEQLKVDKSFAGAATQLRHA
ncbi:RraA family protein [Pseudorhizobium flavum]|uniref:Putative 4-hydroxy-4-methyl-2-oxoglutarate aldolase n=1 Tax=Pseudorhizobium flavum TaxID=1335061 RepID=A0A7W9Z0Q5_9HYPH|nr:RraA family protein [Pseudorhizobium flavum]MBB6181914.1 regulator of RNase E activity RraA [Pseudorhizobium flavum]CAD6628822.1 demethylmenaquinone methyltransferase [Pseudorhizobium flavum]